jgi:hypothetical protein
MHDSFWMQFLDGLEPLQAAYPEAVRFVQQVFSDQFNSAAIF